MNSAAGLAAPAAAVTGPGPAAAAAAAAAPAPAVMLPRIVGLYFHNKGAVEKESMPDSSTQVISTALAFNPRNEIRTAEQLPIKMTNIISAAAGVLLMLLLLLA